VSITIKYKNTIYPKNPEKGGLTYVDCSF